MREFNTMGPCDPALHYTVMREALLEIGHQKVDKGRFFTIFAPRQTGKTTYFQLLMKRVQQHGYTAIWISCEDFKQLSRPRFYEALSQELTREFAVQGLELELALRDAVDLRQFFANIKTATNPLLLIIDEFEGIPETVLSELMHAFRHIYHRKEHYALHALVLVGVSTIAELVVGPASPFNIADEIELDYFSLAEIKELIKQYTAETGQRFEAAVIEAIFENTQGQPGLVCALSHHLVNEVVPNKTRPITMADFYTTIDHFLTQRVHHNIINIVQKARQQQRFMLRLLFQPGPIPFVSYDPTISWLHANGVIKNQAGQVEVAVPLYQKVLITAFRPLVNGESEHYLTSVRDVLRDYLTADGRGLNLNAMLRAYRAYVQRRGFRAFDTEKLREGAWHYSLDGFISFFIEQLGGKTYIEVPSGRGRVDILIRYREQSYIIETKIFGLLTDFKRGKAQLAAYLESEGLHEGYYVVFSNLHTTEDELYMEDDINGRRIYTYIIRTKFERPSEAHVPSEER